jgi:hypothetical protein
MPLYKNDPKRRPFIDGHNMKAVNELKTFIFLYFLSQNTASSLLVKNTYKYPYSLKAVNGTTFGGLFLSGAYFPKKLTPKSSIKTRYKLFQKHVPSY